MPAPSRSMTVRVTIPSPHGDGCDDTEWVEATAEAEYDLDQRTGEIHLRGVILHGLVDVLDLLSDLEVDDIVERAFWREVYR